MTRECESQSVWCMIDQIHISFMEICICTTARLFENSNTCFKHYQSDKQNSSCICKTNQTEQHEHKTAGLFRLYFIMLTYS